MAKFETSIECMTPDHALSAAEVVRKEIPGSEVSVCESNVIVVHEGRWPESVFMHGPELFGREKNHPSFESAGFNYYNEPE